MEQIEPECKRAESCFEKPSLLSVYLAALHETSGYAAASDVKKKKRGR